MSRLKTDAIRNTSASADALTFDTNGNTKIADNEELQIGTGGDLVLKHDGSDSYIKDTGTGGLIINTNAFYVNNAGQTENMITAAENGAVALYHDNTKQCETSATGLAFPSGKGIDFSATANGATGSTNSELFDDYEEGSFTPTWVGVTNLANKSVWRYTKIGDQCRIWGRFTCDTTTNNTTDIYFTGIPYTSKDNFNNSWSENIAAVMSSPFTTNPLYAYLAWNSTGVSLFRGGYQELESNAIGVADSFIVDLTYTAA